LGFEGQAGCLRHRATAAPTATMSARTTDRPRTGRRRVVRAGTVGAAAAGGAEVTVPTGVCVVEVVVEGRGDADGEIESGGFVVGTS